MADLSPETGFLGKLTEIIEENISNEQFGVSELAKEVGMSRSNLLRKVKNLTKLSVSQLIKQVRLKNALELLRQSSLNVSEVSFQVGFGSTSYFIKCFHDFYGYPPGEVGNREEEQSDSPEVGESSKTRRYVIVAAASIIVIFSAVVIFFLKPGTRITKDTEKSIAVLPFINDSNDSTNVYLINGLMESLLNNLQGIKDLRVISRTSVEKYRDNLKSIPEIAKELNVHYLIEGSGQKIGDQILLNIQLIEATNDNHLWAAQYNREVKDIFLLQREIAKNIVSKIEVIITPEEEERIDKSPTTNLEAYDNFLKGLDLLYKGNPESIEQAIIYFRKAIEQDSEFARAYADVAIGYYLLDANQNEKKYLEEINSYSDQALLYDPQLPQSLIAKALYYYNNSEYEQGATYLEKALEYHPNSALVINMLSDFYTSYIPNTEKYLEYALKGISLDIGAHDSVTASFIFLHVSNSLIQTGFVDEALKYINMSLEYHPTNLFSQYVKAYILYAKHGDFEKTKKLLISALKQDTSRLDIIQETGKICYFMGDYENAYQYYDKLNKIRKALNLNVYRFENAKIGLVLSKMGKDAEAKAYFADYKEFADNDQSIYKDLSLGVYYSYHGEVEKALEHLRFFSQQVNYHYWSVIFLDHDPLLKPIIDHPEFRKIQGEIEFNFWSNHNRIKASLIKKGLIE